MQDNICELDRSEISRAARALASAFEEHFLNKELFKSRKLLERFFVFFLDLLSCYDGSSVFCYKKGREIVGAAVLVKPEISPPAWLFLKAAFKAVFLFPPRVLRRFVSLARLSLTPPSEDLFPPQTHVAREARARHRSISSKDIELLFLGTAPQWQSRGIGEKLVRRCLEYASNNGYKSVSLSVDASSRAKRLYERIGFRKCGELVFLSTRNYLMRFDLTAQDLTEREGKWTTS